MMKDSIITLMATVLCVLSEIFYILNGDNHACVRYVYSHNMVILLLVSSSLLLVCRFVGFFVCLLPKYSGHLCVFFRPSECNHQTTEIIGTHDGRYVAGYLR